MPNLVEANQNRIDLIAASLTYRLMQYGWAYHGGAWRGFGGGERLVGVLYRDDAIRWHRAGNTLACIYQQNIKPLGLVNQSFGEQAIVEENLTERYHQNLDVAKGVTYEDTVSHTFVSTTTQENAYDQGIKLLFEEAIRIGAGSTESGVTGNLRSQQELTAEFHQKYGSSEQTSDTLSRKLTVPGPWSGMYEFVRTRNKVEQRVTARADYESSISICDETNIWQDDRNIFEILFNTRGEGHQNRITVEWDSIAQLLSVMRREAPSTAPMYTEYMEHPEDAGYIEAIAAPPGESSFLMKFDDVTSADVLIRETIKATKLTPATPVRNK